MKSAFLAFWLSGFLMLTACDGSRDAETSPKEHDAPATGEADVTPGAIAATEQALRKEPRILDHHVEPGGPIEWQVGVINNGSAEFGFAEYICMIAKENGAVRDNTDVRVVDINMVTGGKDFRSASLGTVNCANGQRLDDAPAARASVDPHSPS